MGKKYISTDYDKFTTLPGNRPIEEHRVKKLMESLRKHGYRESQPVIINNRGQKVDGQARVEACRRLGIPFVYEVDPDAGLEECIAINNSNTPWTLENYINAYAEDGRLPYIYLRNLQKEFKGVFGIRTLMSAFAKTMGGENTIVKSGMLKGGEIEYVDARLALDWLKQFENILNRIGSKTYYQPALLFCYFNNDVDLTRLYEAFYKQQHKLYPVGKVDQAIALLNSIYNYSLKKNRVDIEQAYKDEKNKRKVEAGKLGAKNRIAKKR